MHAIRLSLLAVIGLVSLPASSLIGSTPTAQMADSMKGMSRPLFQVADSMKGMSRPLAHVNNVALV